MEAELEIPVPHMEALEESKRGCILEGKTRSYPGNASLTQYFQAVLGEGRINGDGVAIIDEERKLTFKELDLISSKLARILRIEVGASELLSSNPDGDVVIGICLPHSDKLLIVIFAILKLGAAYLPFDVHFPEDRVIKIVDNSRPIIIISDPHGPTIAKFNPVSNYTKIITIDALMDKVAELAAVNPATINLVEPVPGLTAKAERVAIVLYTSGSSGSPKGVRLTHRTIMNRLYWQWKQFPFKSGERCCFKTALTFVDSVPEIFAPLLQGYSLTIFGKHITSHPHSLVQRISDNQITRFILVPSLLRSILVTLDVVGEVGHDLKTVTLWICSGETLTKDLVDEFFLKFPTGSTICNFYGSTEIMGDVTYEVFSSANDINEKMDGPHLPIGKCIFNTIVYILDEDMGITSEGEIGEIYIAGYNLCSGYVGSTGVDKFMPNPFTKSAGFNRLFRTGDFGRVKRVKASDDTGTLFFEGRLDSQVKIRGQRIDTGEIEATLATRTDLIDTVVVLVYHRDQEDQALVAFVLPKSKDITADRIDMMMKTKLKPIEFPEIRLVDEIPFLVNGKVNRQRLLQQYDERRLNRTEIQWQTLNIPSEFLNGAIALVQTIAQVTGTSEHEIVGDLDDSFYNLGGTSLNSIMVISKLRLKRFQISISDFISAKSIREMIPLVQPYFGTVIATEQRKKASTAMYYAERVHDMHKEAVREIIAFSFSHKGDLEMYTDATYSEFSALVDSIWGELVRAGLSFVVCRVTDHTPIACSLNFDVEAEPEDITVAKSIQKVFDFLEFIESKQRDKLPKGKGKVWHSFMMGTAEQVDESENVGLVLYMEEENIRRAKEKLFTGIMTTNTNPLTMQVCEDLLGYEQLISFEINTYVAEDGSKPFALAPDSQVAVCCWKKLENTALPASTSDNVV